MSQPATIYRMWQNGTWNHPTLPPVNPNPDEPPPPPPPPPDLLWFGTTLFGCSYANYKKQTISSVQNRYYQVEYDTVFGGVRGAAVSREFNSNSTSPGTFTGQTTPH